MKIKCNFYIYQVYAIGKSSPEKEHHTRILGKCVVFTDF